MDKRQIKLGIYGFLFVLLSAMLFLKPYLPRAFYHNFASIDDYRFFNNRIVSIKGAGESWAESQEAKLTLTPSLIQKLNELDTTALLVVDQGKISYENYWLGGGRNEISGSFSVAKSIVSLLTGFAIQDKALESVDESIDFWIPEWSKREPSQITIKNLLTMSSGLDWNESYGNPFSITTESYYGENLLQTAFRQRTRIAPGSQFQYHSGATQLLGIVVSRAVKKSLAQYASEKLWIPLGAEKEALWSLDHEEGTEKAYCCFNATARDFARIGQFVLQHGKWKGEQLLNETYIKEMLSPNLIPDESLKPTDYYGYQWWILKTPSGDVPYARGILGQYIIVIPQKQRVIIRLGKKKGKTFDHHPEEVRELVKWSLENS